MKRYLKKLLLCASAVLGSAFVKAESNVIGESTAAFPSIRRVDCLGLVGGSGMGSLMQANEEDSDKVGGCFSAAWTYEGVFKGRGGKALGELIGIGGKDSFTISTESSADMNVNRIINLKDIAGTGSTTAAVNPMATINLAPDVKRVAGFLCYCHSLGSFYEGLSIGVEAPIVWMKTSLNATYANTKAAIPGSGGTAAGSVNDIKDVAQFFEASASGDTAALAKQEKLQYLLFTEAKSDLGVQGIPVWLKLRVVDGENFKAGIAGKIQIPVGSEEFDLKHVFSPRVNDRHFRFGGSLCLDMCLVEGSDYKASLDAHAQYLYGWKREGKRAPIYTERAFGHYQLVLSPSNMEIPKPLVNLLIDNGGMTVDVKPRHQFDIAACLSVEKGCFVVDARYVFRLKNKEQNEVKFSKDFSKDNIYFYDSMTKGTYTVPGANATVADFVNAATTAKFDKVEMNKITTDLTASYSHYFGLGLGCVFKDMQYPASISLTGGYEWNQGAPKHPDMYSVGVKGSICF